MTPHIETEGSTIQAAIDDGLKKLGLKRHEVEVEVLREETKGLFGMMGETAAKVRLTRKTDLSEQ